MPLLTLTTDFGSNSPYVAQMKGVILSRCPAANIVDITHGIAPQNIREAAIVLHDVAPRFPTGTLHVAVIDPGVGTKRQLIYAEIGTQKFLAPNNGLLSLLANDLPVANLIALDQPQFWLANVSSTFHGRDILSPVAAELLLGRSPQELGTKLESLISLPLPQAIPTADGNLQGEVIFIDSFGNLLTNITADVLPAERQQISVAFGIHQLQGVQTTYGHTAAGELIALVDSQGRLEIAVVNGNAAEHLAAGVGMKVTIGWS